MTTINGRACVVDGTPVDKVFSNGRQVYGRNLYQDTRDFDNPTVWNHFGYWTKTGEIYNGMTVISTEDDWNGLSQKWDVKKGETYTFSVYARYKSGTGESIMYTGGAQNTNPWTMHYSLNETWQRIYITFGVTLNGNIQPRLERSNYGNNNNTLLIAGPKLERGSVATPCTQAPEDVLK